MSNRFNQVCVIIPSLEPDIRLIQLVSDLIAYNLENIIVVNDGSSDDYDSIFADVKDQGVTLLRHATNQGKGRALKTAFNYILNEGLAYNYIVTCDSDGQHLPSDIIKCLNQADSQSLTLGARNFYQKDVPFKSKFGNLITRFILNVLCDVKIQDTQTGLRIFPKELLKGFLSVEGERFEYETYMLLYAKEHGIEFKDVEINTVYLNENKSTHFNPIIDSIRIYKIFWKFMFSALSSFLVDFVFYTIFLSVFKGNQKFDVIVVSVVLARLISSFYNYKMNKTIVFNSDNRSSLWRYYCLCIIQMLISAFLTSYLVHLLRFGDYLLKIIVDVILFVLSFRIQKKWVFKKSN